MPLKTRPAENVTHFGANHLSLADHRALAVLRQRVRVTLEARTAFPFGDSTVRLPAGRFALPE